MVGKKGMSVVLAAAVLAVMGGGSAARATNLLYNGGFETQGAGDATTADGWNLSGAGGVTPTQAIRDTNNPNSGSYDLHLQVTGSGSAGGPVANAISAFSTAVPATVTPGTKYTLNFDMAGNFGPGAVMPVFIDFYDTNGGLLTRDLVDFLTGANATYTPYTETDTAPANSAYYDVFFNFAGGAFDGSTGDVSIDDVSFNSPDVAVGGTVPEPASLSILALAGIGALVRRRR
jgi:hypothetical protein